MWWMSGVVDVWCGGCLVWWMSVWWMSYNQETVNGTNNHGYAESLVSPGYIFLPILYYPAINIAK